MKKLITMLAAVITSALAFAGPFGLTMGMTMDEVTAACGGVTPQKLQDDMYQIQPVAKEHSFTYAVAYIDEKQGLYSIRAISKEIPTDKYGKEIKDEFSRMQEVLSASYGAGTVKDQLQPNSKQKGSAKWTISLSQGERELSCTWINEENKQLPDDLDMVVLSAKAEFNIKGYMLIEYQFSNYYEIGNGGDLFW